MRDSYRTHGRYTDIHHIPNGRTKLTVEKGSRVKKNRTSIDSVTISKSNVAAAKGKDKQEIARVFISVNWNKSACNSIGVTAFIQLVFISLFIAFTHGASYITSPTPLLLLQSLPYTFPKYVNIL